MSRDIHRAPTADGALDAATTEVRRRPLTGHRLERYVAWLEQIAQSLAGAGASAHLMSCEQLIGELRRTIRADTEAGPMAPEIRQCIGGMRSILRAVRARELKLDPALRRELVELVADVTETVLERDLGDEA